MPEKVTQNKKNAAIICELNPLHKGHEALFRQVKQRAEGLVCVMSGNFVQRGEPAILDKWARCRLALEAGADLVLELPLPWACAGAERFAAGGVHLLSALGTVDYLAFGSEFPWQEQLSRIAQALLSEDFSRALAALPDHGEPFAQRREQALIALLGEEILPLLRSPNAILGIEYEKALLREQSSIQPLVFPRVGAGHDKAAADDENRSAGELRELLRAGKALDGLVPDYTAGLLAEEIKAGRCPADTALLERAILCKLRTMTLPEFAALPDVSEGLEHRLLAAAGKSGTLEEFLALVKSKRYSHARLRRLALYAFLGVTRDLPALPPYLRVLGMTDSGEKLLKKASPALPIAARAADFQRLGGDALRLFQLEAAADDLYALMTPVPVPCGRDYTEKLIKEHLSRGASPK